jgi:hypothetical protein
MVICLWEELAQLEIELEFYVTLPILVQCTKCEKKPSETPNLCTGNRCSIICCMTSAYVAYGVVFNSR